MNVRLLGAPRTGTNYLKWLIRNNYNVILLNEDNHKSGRPPGAAAKSGSPPEIEPRPQTSLRCRAQAESAEEHWQYNPPTASSPRSRRWSTTTRF